MNEKIFSLQVMLFWIIPGVGSDIVEALSHHDNLTPAGTSITSLFLTILLMALWVWCGMRAWRDGASQSRANTIRDLYRHGWVAIYAGKQFLMLPGDKDLREEIARGDKKPAYFVDAGETRH